MAGGLNDILVQVNGPILAFLNAGPSFAGYLAFGLVTNAYRNGKPELYPVGFSKEGTGVYAGIDDEKPIIIYHKCDRLTPTKRIAKYGDGKGEMINRYDMRMIIFHSRKALGIEADELYLLLQQVFPETVAVEPYTSVTLSIKNVILNPQQVFRNEYQGVNYFVKPEHSLMQIDYTIESILKPGCFNISYYS